MFVADWLKVILRLAWLFCAGNPRIHQDASMISVTIYLVSTFKLESSGKLILYRNKLVAECIGMHDAYC